MTLKKMITTSLTAAVLTALGGTPMAFADDRAPSKERAPASDRSPTNTAENNPDNSPEGQKPTADQSKNDKSDVKLAAEIRRSVIRDKALSTSAHNVKIIVENGFVTLKGPVKSNAEKLSVQKKADEVVGAKNVHNEIEVSP